MHRRKRGTRWLATLASAALMAALIPMSTALAEDGTSASESSLTSIIQTGNGTPSSAQQEVESEPQKTPSESRQGTSTKVYVDKNGDDESGDGTKNRPYASLAEAVEEAVDGATIYVMSDLEMHECARFYDKSLTITSDGGPHTLSRADQFEYFDSQSDTARSWYNPALIEVGNTSEGAVPTSLTLTNIILDDNFTHTGQYFIQADSNGDGNTFFEKTISNLDIVQDAMVATYAPSVTINLGIGTVLKNFGGMSAVRITGGSHLNMQTGSKICDDKDKTFTRVKGTKIDGADTNLYGPAGAIWSQGGNVTIENGASIEDVNGRALYMDGGDAKVYGTISGIKSNKAAMWQEETGFVIHLRGGAQATLGKTGVIDGNGVESSGTAIDVPEDCKFTADEKSLITKLNKSTAISTDGTVDFAGEIKDCYGWGHALAAQSGNYHVTLRPTAYIHNNQCGYGTIYAQSGESGIIDIYGRINNNISNDRAGGIAMANNYDSTKVNMYDGAEIRGNVSYQTGGGIMVSAGTFTMHGGIIADNISGVNTNADADKAGGGVFVRRGGQFIMKSGTIENNTAAGIGGNIAFVPQDYNGSVPYIQLDNGSVTGGSMRATVSGNDSAGYTASSGEANDIAVTSVDDKGKGVAYGKTTRYLSISNKVALSVPNIFMEKYEFYLENLGEGVKLGNAADANEDAAMTEVRNFLKKKGINGRTVSLQGSFWYQTNSFKTAKISGFDKPDDDSSLYAVIVPTDEDGLPITDSAESDDLLNAIVWDENDSFSLSMPAQSKNGYAVVFIQIDVPSVTVIPADITVYEGGNSVNNSSMPQSLFAITLSDGTDLDDLKFTTSSGDESWTAVSVGDGYYRLVSEDDQADVQVTYTDEDGEAVTSDEFDVSSAGDTFEQFAINLHFGNIKNSDIIITNSEAAELSYVFTPSRGTLTVRAVENDPDVAVSKLEAPSTPLESGTALAVEPEEGTTYTLNDTEVELPQEKAEPSLLFDDILTSDNINRVDALEKKADEKLEKLGNPDSADREYQAKYLDLVDANNSNAWITSSNGTDIYWAYPEGTDQDTRFTLLHFTGLHRDGENSGYDVNDIESIDLSDVEEITVENMPQGIRFHVKEGGFSPFVLTWQSDEQAGGQTTTPTQQTEASEKPGATSGEKDTGSLSLTGGATGWAVVIAMACLVAAVALVSCRVMRHGR